MHKNALFHFVDPKPLLPQLAWIFRMPVPFPLLYSQDLFGDFEHEAVKHHRTCSEPPLL